MEKETRTTTDMVEKVKAISATKADTAADIKLINRYSKKELTPDEIYCFSVDACDNEVDRADEFFPDKSLEVLAKLFEGKTVITDHRRSAGNQMARIYRCQVEETGEKTVYGATKKVLRVDAYMLNNETNAATIESIEGGILKEVSVSCSTAEYNCSICKKPMSFKWSTWSYECENGHVVGQDYDEGHCSGRFDKPKDAYELSFVAVPCQRGAGVRKGAENPNVDDAFRLLMTADLSSYPDQVKALIPSLKKAFTTSAEREERDKILKENERFIKKGD